MSASTPTISAAEPSGSAAAEIEQGTTGTGEENGIIAGFAMADCSAPRIDRQNARRIPANIHKGTPKQLHDLCIACDPTLGMPQS